MKELILNVINLPRDFLQKETISMYALLEETGYFDIADQVSEQDLYDNLVIFPDFANDWFQYSQDKRCDDGWYIKLSDNNKYLVGCLDTDNNIEIEFDEKLKACATYIKRELDKIKSS